MKGQDIYREVAKKVKVKKGFIHHFLTYILMLVMPYAVLHFEGNGEILPVIIVGLTWGITIVIHYLNTFGMQHLDRFGINPHWEEEEIEKEIERLKGKRALKNEIQKDKKLQEDFDNPTLRTFESNPRQDDFFR